MSLSYTEVNVCLFNANKPKMYAPSFSAKSKNTAVINLAYEGMIWKI